MSLLLSPIHLGPIALGHRVVMAPLTRSRAVRPGDVPGDLMLEYYAQRASAGGLIIAEGATVSSTGRGWLGAPGMFTDEQVAGWRRILLAVDICSLSSGTPDDRLMSASPKGRHRYRHR
jgi:N-ethylmaleimide reductase